MPSVDSLVFDPTRHSWDEVKDTVLQLEAICFSDGGLGEEYLKKWH